MHKISWDFEIQQNTQFWPENPIEYEQVQRTCYLMEFAVLQD